MTEQENAGNIVLAEFIGKTVYPAKVPAKNKQGWKYSYPWKGEAKDFEWFQLQFHASLDWLWPVWVKFREVQHQKDSQLESLGARGARVHNEWIVHAFTKGTVTDIFNALVDAVKWYNSINK